jgi:hypothetical protein
MIGPFCPEPPRTVWVLTSIPPCNAVLETSGTPFGPFAAVLTFNANGASLPVTESNLFLRLREDLTNYLYYGTHSLTYTGAVMSVSTQAVIGTVPGRTYYCSAYTVDSGGMCSAWTPEISWTPTNASTTLAWNPAPQPILVMR